MRMIKLLGSGSCPRLFLLSGLGAVVSAAFLTHRTASAQAGARVEKTIQGDPLYNVLPPDRIRSIDQPQFVSGERARLSDEARVIAVSLNGEHHVYALLLLNAHEIVNDVVGGEPIATTW